MRCAILALLKRDLKLATRQGGGVGSALGFFLTVIVLLPIGIGPDNVTLQRLAPGILWITLLLSVLLSADRIFQQDFEDGSLDTMAMAPLPLEVTAFTKASAHWLSTSLPLSMMAPFLGILLNVKTELIGQLFVSMVIGSLGLSFIATIGASLTVNLRRGGLLISVLILPLYIPILVFGISACSEMTDLIKPSLLMLVALVLLSIVLAPLASAAALRAYLR